MTPSVRLQELASALGQYDCDVAMSVHLRRSNEALFAQVAEVASVGVEGPSVMVAEVPRRHDPKAADDAQRSGFRVAKGVFAVPVADDLSVGPGGKVQLVYEGIARIEPSAVAFVAAAVASIIR